jgi:hypothetical protein
VRDQKFTFVRQGVVLAFENGEPSAKSTERQMKYVDITQSEEMPVLSTYEKAELIRSLEDSQVLITRGEGKTFKPGEFGKWMRDQMLEIRAGRKRAL